MEYRDAIYGAEFFKDIMDCIEDLMREKKCYLDPSITLTDLVRIVGTNRSYLSRAISWHCGSHFNDYVNGWRIRDAVSKALAMKGNANLYEIALACGFNHRRTFHRAFVREIGIPPSNYMKKQKSKGRDVL